jgi:hypothetical protein
MAKHVPKHGKSAWLIGICYDFERIVFWREWLPDLLSEEVAFRLGYLYPFMTRCNGAVGIIYTPGQGGFNPFLQLTPPCNLCIQYAHGFGASSAFCGSYG